eukprot:GDKK01049912.1.p1 GENE.GDKK01049912.1~~GDKK01049912.1.p1  ORF type:complete len:308 (+),score=110.79 GDKK01049912.1:43-966(+)
MEDSSVLAQEVLKSSLKQIKRTLDGSGFAFTRLDCKGQGISIIPPFMEEFKHLLFIDISENSISNITPFSKLPNVLTFDASQNQIDSLECFSSEPSLEACQIMSLSQNRISKLVKIQIPTIKRLNLSENQISSVDETFDGHLELQSLNLSKNQLKSCDGIVGLPELRELDLSENQITSIGSMNDCPNLESLDLSGNQLTTLENIANLSGLKKLAVRDNQIEDFKELKQLQNLPLLREFSVEGNPCAGDEEALKIELLLIMPRLTSINGNIITDEDRQVAKDTAAERKREEEEKLAAANEKENDGDNE